MTYNAIVAEVTNLREHSNADRLQLATILGSQVVLGLEHYEGERVVYFPTDGILSDEYCKKNELYPVYDEEGKRIGGGFFTPGKARVRTQNFRGEKSDGFVATVDSLAYTGYDLSKLSIGAQFSELNGHKICEKYFSPATVRAMNAGGKKARKANVMFPKHVDTEQWAYNKEYIKPGTVCYITEKTHGTSARYGMALVERSESGIKARLRRLLGRPAKEDWELLTGTRNVVLSASSGVGFYGDDTFRYKIAERLEGNLRHGEIIYGEIVGWASEATPIMPKASTKDLQKNKWFKDIFHGEVPTEIEYNYGCARGECEFYVYRIAHSDTSGNVIELSWPQVRTRCSELGLKIVPDIASVYIPDEEELFEDNMRVLTEHMEFDLDRLSRIDHSHIQEGVCVRLEQADGTVKYLKNKSYSFKSLEGIIKTDDSYVDMEESS